jgi:hypothetical protein
MNNNQAQISKGPNTRRKFVTGFGLLSLFAAFAATIGFRSNKNKTAIACKPDSKKKTIKMLSKDGTLVEIDASLIASSGKKASNHELQNWINK